MGKDVGKKDVGNSRQYHRASKPVLWNIWLFFPLHKFKNKMGLWNFRIKYQNIRGASLRKCWAIHRISKTTVLSCGPGLWCWCWRADSQWVLWRFWKRKCVHCCDSHPPCILLTFSSFCRKDLESWNDKMGTEKRWRKVRGWMRSLCHSQWASRSSFSWREARHAAQVKVKGFMFLTSDYATWEDQRLFRCQTVARLMVSWEWVSPTHQPTCLWVYTLQYAARGAVVCSCCAGCLSVARKGHTSRSRRVPGYTLWSAYLGLMSRGSRSVFNVTKPLDTRESRD